jgi:hypothetical protein
MPTCYVHRRQLKITGRYRAPLRCGFECGRIGEWMLHGFQLCIDYREHSMTCYFMKIPLEMRLCIYQFLLPDRPIPARYERSSLTSDGGGVYMPILSVNHQIHDEAVGLLYRTRAFSIEILGDWLSMCNLSQQVFWLQNPCTRRSSVAADESWATGSLHSKARATYPRRSIEFNPYNDDRRQSVTRQVPDY